jgi:hypothetical protein
MILFNLACHKDSTLSQQQLEELQSFVPFSLSSVIKSVPDPILTSIIDRAIYELSISRINEYFLEEFNRTGNFEQMEFKNINLKCSKLKSFVSAIQKKRDAVSLEKTTWEQLDSLKMLLDLLNVSMDKLVRKQLALDEFYVFGRKLFRENLISDRNLSTSFMTVIRSLNTAFECLLRHHLEFTQELLSVNFMEFDFTVLGPLCMKSVYLQSREYLETTLFQRSLIETTIALQKKKSFRPIENHLTPTSIKEAIKSHIQWLFYDFQDICPGIMNLQALNKEVCIWERKAVNLRRRLEEVSQLESDIILTQKDPLKGLVSAEELSEVLTVQDPKLKEIIKRLPEYAKIKEKEFRFEDNEIQTFEDVFFEVIREEKPLTPADMEIVLKESYKRKIEIFLQGRIHLSESELVSLAKLMQESFDLDDCDTNISRVKWIIDGMRNVNHPNFPENIKGGETGLIKFVEEQINGIKTYRVDEGFKRKIERLKYVLDFVERARAELLSQGVLDEKSSDESWLELYEEDLAGEVDWNAFSYLSDRLILKQSVLVYFPTRRRFITRLYNGYLKHLVESLTFADLNLMAYKFEEHVNLHNLYAIEKILAAHPHPPSLPAKYAGCKKQVSDFLRHIIKFTRIEQIGWTDYKLMVEELEVARARFRGLTHPAARKLKQAFAFYDDLYIMVRILARVKSFRVQDLTCKTLEYLRLVNELLGTGTYQLLPIAYSSAHLKEIAEYTRYFGELALLHKDFAELNEEVAIFREEYLGRGATVKLKRLLRGLFKLPDIARANQLCSRLSRYLVLDDIYYSLCSEMEDFSKLEEHLDEFWASKKYLGGIPNYADVRFQEELHKYLIYLQRDRLESSWFISEKVKFQVAFLCIFQKLIQLVYIERNLSEIEQKYQKIICLDLMTEPIMAELRQRGVIELIESRISSGKDLREDFMNSKQFSIEGYFNLVNRLKESKLNIFPVEDPEHQGFESLVVRIQKIEKYYIDGIPIPEGFGNSELQQLVLNRFAPDSLKEWINKQINQETFLNCWAQALLKRRSRSKKEMQKLLEVIRSTGIQIKEQQALEDAYQEAEGKLRRLCAEASEIEDTPDRLHRVLEDRIRNLICDVLEVKYTFEMEQLELLLKMYIAWVSKLHLLNAKLDAPAESKIDLSSVYLIIDQTSDLITLLKNGREPFALLDIQVKRPENAMMCELESGNGPIHSGLGKVRSSLSPIFEEIETARKIIYEALIELKTQLERSIKPQEDMEPQPKQGSSMKDRLKDILLKLSLNPALLQLLDFDGISTQLDKAILEEGSMDRYIKAFEERPSLKKLLDEASDRGEYRGERDEKAILELCLVSLQQRDQILASALNGALQSNDFVCPAKIENQIEPEEGLQSSKGTTMSPEEKAKSKKSLNQKVLQQKKQGSSKTSSNKTSESKAESVSINVKASDVLSESSKVLQNTLSRNKEIQEDRLDALESKEISESKNIRKRTPETEKSGNRNRKQPEKGILAEEKSELGFKELPIPRLTFKFTKGGSKGRSAPSITCCKSKFYLAEKGEDARLQDWIKEIVLEFTDVAADDKDFVQLLKEVELREGKKERHGKSLTSGENIVVGKFKPQSNQLRDVLLKNSHWLAEHDDGSKMYIFKSKNLKHDQLNYSGFLPQSSAKYSDLIPFVIDFRGRAKPRGESKPSKLKKEEKSTRNVESRGSDKQSKEDQDSAMKSKSPVQANGFKPHDSRGNGDRLKRIAEENNKGSNGRRGDKRNNK